MNIRMILPALLSAVVLSTPVLAAGTPTQGAHGWNPLKYFQETTAERCVTLEGQLDLAIKAHAKSARISEARALRATGGSLCGNGRDAAGIAKLEQGFTVLGVENLS